MSAPAELIRIPSVDDPALLRSTAIFSVLLGYLVLAGCSSPSNSAPTVAFSKVAAAYEESPYKTDMTERD